MKTPRMGLVLLPASFCLLAIMACSAVPFAPGPTVTPDPTVRAGGSGKELALRLNFYEGEVYRMRLVSEQTIEQSLEGEKVETDQKIGYEFRYKIVNVDPDGNAWMEVLYTWAMLEQDTPTGKIRYDSSNPPAEVPPGAEGFSVLVGHGFSLLTSPDGTILKIRGLEELYEDMTAAMNLEDPELEAQFLKVFREQFGEEAMKQQCGNLTAYLPKEPIQVGESWTTRTESSLMVPMIIDTTYTLRAQEGDLATIEMSSTISPNPDAEYLDFGIAKLGYSLSGTQEGVTTVDTTTGLANAEFEQSLSGEMILLIEEEQTRMPVFIKSVTHVESVLEK